MLQEKHAGVTVLMIVGSHSRDEKGCLGGTVGGGTAVTQCVYRADMGYRYRSCEEVFFSKPKTNRRVEETSRDATRVASGGASSVIRKDAVNLLARTRGETRFGVVEQFFALQSGVSSR